MQLAIKGLKKLLNAGSSSFEAEHPRCFAVLPTNQEK